jgi:rod shape determining protein RodA
VITGIPLLLIFKQPDLGTALVYGGILVSMLACAKIPIRYYIFIFSAIAFVFALLAFLYHFQPDIFFSIIHEYQWNRIVYWFNPWLDPNDEGYQLIQSLIAVGSGQLTGKGLAAESLAMHGWLPVGESDFIFTVIAEKMGFIGASILIFLFFFLVYRIIRIAMEAKDYFGMFVCAGVAGMIVFQVFENIGMTIQLMPITGIPLPFISYGGSSLISNFMIIGFVINIGMRRKKMMFE